MPCDIPAGEQEHWRALKTDKFLRVAGTDGSVFALGDAATVSQVSLALLTPVPACGPVPSRPQELQGKALGVGCHQTLLSTACGAHDRVIPSRCNPVEQAARRALWSGNRGL